MQLRKKNNSRFVGASVLGVMIAVSINPSLKASDMFNVTATHPGSFAFSGSGTAQFNNSLGTNNSFQVGSNTNLGVNGSVSSTTGYSAGSHSIFETGGGPLGEPTSLRQITGTTLAEKNFQEAESFADVEGSEAHKSAEKRWKEKNGSTWDNYKAANLDTTTGEISSDATYQTANDWYGGSEKSARAAYDTVFAASTKHYLANRSTDDGTISGSFRTFESGTARASGNATDWDLEASAIAGGGGRGASYEARDVSHRHISEEEWQDDYDRTYNEAYANSSAASNRYSDSTVNARGLGSDSVVIATDDSSFEVNIGKLSASHTPTTEISTANGSAGFSLSTASFVNQSNTSTASGFLQAFGSNTASDTSKTAGTSIPHCGLSSGLCWDMAAGASNDLVYVFSRPPSSADSNGEGIILTVPWGEAFDSEGPPAIDVNGEGIIYAAPDFNERISLERLNSLRSQS